MDAEKLKKWTIYQATKAWPKSKVESDGDTHTPSQGQLHADLSNEISKSDIIVLPDDLDATTRRRLEYIIKCFRKPNAFDTRTAQDVIYEERVKTLLARHILNELETQNAESNKLN